ncbi:MAG: hypothetical protein RR515_01780 [Clostridium sp.]
MATLVKWKKDNNKYIYMGCSFSHYVSKMESFIGGALLPNVEEGTYNVILLSNEKGELMWVNAEEVELISIDGKYPNEILING